MAPYPSPSSPDRKSLSLMFSIDPRWNSTQVWGNWTDDKVALEHQLLGLIAIRVFLVSTHFTYKLDILTDSYYVGAYSHGNNGTQSFIGSLRWILDRIPFQSNRLLKPRKRLTFSAFKVSPSNMAKVGAAAVATGLRLKTAAS
jgi:hypothetical protein